MKTMFADFVTKLYFQDNYYSAYNILCLLQNRYMMRLFYYPLPHVLNNNFYLKHNTVRIAIRIDIAVRSVIVRVHIAIGISVRIHTRSIAIDIGIVDIVRTLHKIPL